MAIGSERHLTSAPGRFLVLSLRLRDRRRSLGLTQQQVVRRLAGFGISTSNKALSSLEHGAGIDAAKLPEFAAALDCTVTYLLGLTDDPSNWQPDSSLELAPRPIAEPPARRPAEDRGTPARQASEVREIKAAQPEPRLQSEPENVAAPEPDSGHDPSAATSWILGPYLAGSAPSSHLDSPAPD